MEFDLLIHNGIVVTVNNKFDIIKNGIVCISDSKIHKIIAKGENSRLPDSVETIDAGGGLIMPGLVNTHTHLPMSLFRGLADDLPLMTWLNEYIFPYEAKYINAENVKLGSLLSCAELLLSGTTTCCDGYFFENEVAEAVQTAGLRAVLGHGIIDFPAPGVSDPKKNVTHAGGFVKRWKDRYDLITPSLFCHSPYTCSSDTLKKAKNEAVKNGVLFQIHAAETKTEYEQILDEHKTTPVQYLDSLGLLDSDTLLVHSVWTDEKDIEIMAGTGAGVSTATESNMKLASGVAPVPSYLKAGIPIGLGTDSCASNNDLDLFSEMDFTAKIHKSICLDPTILNAETILKMATITGARAIGLDHKTGSIEEGKQADIVIVDINKPHLVPLYNPVSHIVYSANGSDVRDVIVDGKIIVRNRELKTIDVREVMAKVNKICSGFGL